MTPPPFENAKTILCNHIAVGKFGRTVTLLTVQQETGAFATYGIDPATTDRTYDLKDKYSSLDQAFRGHARWRLQLSEPKDRPAIYKKIATKSKFTLYRLGHKSDAIIMQSLRSLCIVRAPHGIHPDAIHLHHELALKPEVRTAVITKGPFLILRGWNHVLNPDNAITKLRLLSSGQNRTKSRFTKQEFESAAAEYLRNIDDDQIYLNGLDYK